MIAGYTLLPSTVYRAPNILYAGYQRSARSFALSVFNESSPMAAAEAVTTYVTLARSDYISLSRVATYRAGGMAYRCFSGTKMSETSQLPAVICGWSQGEQTFTMALAPASSTGDGVRLAQAVVAAIR